MEISNEEYSRLNRRPWGLAKALVSLGVVIVAFVAVYVYGPQIKARIGALEPIIIVQTAGAVKPPAARPRATPIPRQDDAAAQAAVQRKIDEYNAAQQALLDAANRAAIATPLGNVGQTGADAPMYSKPAERQPAGENVPTSLPIEEPAQTDNGHGSKSKPVNIQETKTCLHGQTWVDGRGCKNPTPTQ